MFKTHETNLSVRKSESNWDIVMHNMRVYNAIPNIKTVKKLVHEQYESCSLLAIMVTKCSHDLPYGIAQDLQKPKKSGNYQFYATLRSFCFAWVVVTSYLQKTRSLPLNAYTFQHLRCNNTWAARLTQMTDCGETWICSIVSLVRQSALPVSSL